MLSVGVLVSGSGSNLQALLDATAYGSIPARVSVVISNRPGVLALDRATRAGVPTVLIPHGSYPTREAFDAAVVASLKAHGVELVVLAGFMRIVTRVLLDAFPARVLNVHPSLLPAFPGVNAQAQALEHGVRVAGCTVHLVDGGLDTGPILAQAAVPVKEGDSLEALRARILVEEHRLLPAVVGLIATGKVRVEGRRVRILV